MNLMTVSYTRLVLWAGMQDTVSVYRLQVPSTPPVNDQGLGRYLVLHPITDLRQAVTNARSDEVTQTVQITAAAWLTDTDDDPTEACMWLMQQVRDLFIDWVPDGCGIVRPAPLRQSDHLAPRSDEQVADRKPVYGADQFTTHGQQA